MPPLVLRNATVLPMTGAGVVFEPGHVVVTDGRIASVGPGEPPPSGEGRVLDMSGRVVMPGIVNAHTHLYQTLLRAVWETMPLMPWLQRIYGAAAALRPETFHTGTLLGCLESLKSGVTTVCEHNFLNPDPDSASETVRALRESGLRAVFARTVMDTGDIVPACTKETPQAAFKRIEELLASQSSDGDASDGGRLSFMTGPNTPPINASPELLAQLRDFADSVGIGISAHVAESAQVREAVQRDLGRDGVVAYLSEFGLTGPDAVFAHSVHVSSEEIDIIAQTGTSVSHNPVSNMILGDGVAPVVEMLAAGVNVALGTDGAASNHSQDMFETVKVASLLQRLQHRDPAVIDPYAVLHMATMGGAHALGMDAVCGSLETGKRADIAVVNMDGVHSQPINNVFSQLVHCAKASDVEMVMVDGEVLVEGGRAVTLDEERLLEQARRERRDLHTRLDETGLRD